jgi:hypothetical protein
MGFKVTVRKNGAKHGEMHYSSEAVAVGAASKMRNGGSGVHASVEHCGCAVCAKGNRRRAKRNPRPMRGGSLAALEQKIAMAEAALPKSAVRAALSECGWSGPMLMASRSEMGTYLRELRRHAKANPRRRRNGAVGITASVEQDSLSGGWAVYLHAGNRALNMTDDYFATKAAAQREAKAMLAQARAGVPLDAIAQGFYEAHHKASRRATHPLANRRRNGTTSANMAAARSQHHLFR